MSVISIARDTNNNVCFVRMHVTDTSAQVSSTDYILNHQDEINILNEGTFGWFITDMLLVACSDMNALFQFIDPTFSTLSRYGEQGSGMINPGLINQIAYYSANGSDISGLATLANGILATNNSSVPSITQTLPAAVQGNITATGIISSGTWQGSTVTVPYGGTGDTSFTAYAVICGGTTTTNPLQSIASVGTAGDVFISNGPGMLPTFQSGIASGIINTGNLNDLPYYSINPSGKTLSAISGAVSSVLITSGLGVPSLSQTLPGAVQGNITALGTIATGVWQGTLISPTYGGTGLSNPTAHGIMVGEGASAMTPIVLTAGQVLIGTTSSDPSAAAINSGTGILVGNGSGSITVSLASIADQRILSNISGGNAIPVANTLTATIDECIGSTQGDILYRNSTVWTVLAPGTAGQILSTGGAAANPAWTTTTFPTTGGAAGNILISDGTNYIASTSLWPNTVGTNGKFLISNGTSNGYSTSTIPTSAGATANKVLLSDGTNYVLSTPTFPNASATSRKIIVSDGTNWVASTETYAVPGTSGNVLTSDGTNWTSAAPAVNTVLTTKGDILGFTTTEARVPVGTTNGQVLQVASGASAGISYSTPTYPSASGTSGQILASDGTNNIYTTATYPATTTINQILYSATANVVSGLATSNSSVLITSSGGVPSLSTTLPSGLAATNLTLTTPALGTPSAGVLSSCTATGGVRSFQIFTSGTAQTYTKPANVTSILVEVIGGGGGGGGCADPGAGNIASASGGGGGGYARLYIASAAGTYTYTVGASAAGGVGGNNGTGGNTTSFGASLQATGGNGGTKGLAVSTAGGAQVVAVTGGVGSNGDINISGGPSNWGMALVGQVASGNGGSSFYGTGGVGLAAAVGVGNSGNNYGGGGSGAAASSGAAHNGGAGAAGLIVVWEFS